MTPTIPENFIRPATDADNDRIAAVLEPSTTDMPTIGAQPIEEVTLAGGLLMPDGQVLTEATVRELTGAHEEAIARARNSGNPLRTITALVEAGTATIGGRTPTRDMIMGLLAGDWVTLVVAIRVATYGETYEIDGVQCPHCSGRFDVSVNLTEVPVTELADKTGDRTFRLDLRRGRSAEVRLPTGRDQEAIFEKTGLVDAERNTVVLSRCVNYLYAADGSQTDVGRNPGAVRDGLSIPDRASILAELIKREPGPRLGELSFEPDVCGKEVAFPLTVGDLFRDL